MRWFLSVPVVPACLLAAGCIPYTVGSTARTAPPDRIVSTVSYDAVPGLLTTNGDTTPGVLRGFDAEVRYGLDDHSDIGLRLVDLSGVVMSYKNRFVGETNGDGSAAAFLFAGGFVNQGQQLYAEASLLVSGSENRKSDNITPYGGVRLLGTFTMVKTNVNDFPGPGIFAGLRIGGSRYTLSPELGIYTDRQNVGYWRTRLLFVPGITLQRGGPR